MKNNKKRLFISVTFVLVSYKMSGAAEEQAAWLQEVRDRRGRMRELVRLETQARADRDKDRVQQIRLDLAALARRRVESSDQAWRQVQDWVVPDNADERARMQQAARARFFEATVARIELINFNR